MNNKILIGSIIAVVLLLLMPSISAIQVNINQLDLKDSLTLENDAKFPNLYYVISLWLFFRFYRAIGLLTMSITIDIENHEIQIIHPLIYFRALWLGITARDMNDFLQNLSDKFGWNWRMPI